MPGRRDNMETVALSLEILRRIPRNRSISVSEISEQLTAVGITRNVRSLQRHMQALAEHFDIEIDDRERPFGYRWKERARGLSIPGLSAQEALLLTLAEQHLHALLPANLMKSMAGFFEQARGRLADGEDAGRERDWLKKVRVVSTTQPLLAPKIARGVFDAVSNALYANRLLDVRYRNAKGKTNESRVMPLGLAQQGPRMYLVCRYEGFENERSLALNRIEKATATEFGFDAPKAFDLRRYDDEGRFGFGSGKKIRLTFRIENAAGLHLLESPLAGDQTVREVDGGYEISATVVESEQLEWWLRGFGERLVVLSREAIPAVKAK